MKYPKIVSAVEILDDFVAQVTFDSGEIRTVDFRQLPLAGLFKKIKSDQEFFKTIFVKDGYLMWGIDLSIDSDFVFDHSQQSLTSAEVESKFNQGEDLSDFFATEVDPTNHKPKPRF